MSSKSKPSPLPLKNGLNASRVFLPNESWPSVFEFLVHRFPYMDSHIIWERLCQGAIYDNQGQPINERSPYVPETWLWYYRDVPTETPVPFKIKIIAHDDRLIVVDKPHFLATIPGGRYVQETVLAHLCQQFKTPDISPVHRLDRDTAGVLVFCSDARYRGAYQTLFQNRHVYKAYEAIAPNYPNFPVQGMVYQSRIVRSDQYFTMQQVSGEPNSQTRISLLSQGKQYSHFKLEPLTGKKHQLRVHMSALGIPICNDPFYPTLLPPRADDDFDHPLQLIARCLAFTDPVDGTERCYTSDRVLAMQAQCYSFN